MVHITIYVLLTVATWTNPPNVSNYFVVPTHIIMDTDKIRWMTMGFLKRNAWYLPQYLDVSMDALWIYIGKSYHLISLVRIGHKGFGNNNFWQIQKILICLYGKLIGVELENIMKHINNPMNCNNSVEVVYHNDEDIKIFLLVHTMITNNSPIQTPSHVRCSS